MKECMKLIGSAWTADAIWYLREGERCFSELQADLSGISAKVLTTCLRRLEREGVVERLTRSTSPPTVWYALTPPGRDLSRALVEVVEVGQRLKKSSQGSEPES